MPLQGTFDVLPFADVLELLAGRTATGRLHVRSRATGANIFLDKGRLVGAEVGEQASASPQDVQGRLKDVCFELLEADRGSFEFNPDLTGMGVATIDLEVGQVLEAARIQLEDWRNIQTVVPSLDVHPGLVADLPADEVTLSRAQWRVLSALDSRRSVRAVARLLDLSDYLVSGTLKSLIELGVVELDAAGHPAPLAGRDVTVFVDDAVVWSEPNGNGDGNGTESVAILSEPVVASLDGLESDGAAPEVAAAAPSANGDRDSIWSGNVEDRPVTAAAAPEAPAAPPTPVETPAPAPAPATTPTSATTVPTRQPALPAPPSGEVKARRQGFLGLGRKTPDRPNS